MTILTPEILEKAARALCEGTPFHDLHGEDREWALRVSRACLEAALPGVVGATWQDAINIVVLCGPPGSEQLRDNLIVRMEARIRSLAPLISK